MFLVTLQCDFRDRAEARDVKAKCHSLDNRSIEIEAADLDVAASKIRAAAAVAGWKRRATNRNRSRMGWACPCCAERPA